MLNDNLQYIKNRLRILARVQEWGKNYWRWQHNFLDHVNNKEVYFLYDTSNKSSPAENNQNHSTLTFESLYHWTDKTLYERTKITKIKDLLLSYLPTPQHWPAPLLFAVLLTLVCCWTQFYQPASQPWGEALGAQVCRHMQSSYCHPAFHQTWKQTECQDFQEIPN